MATPAGAESSELTPQSTPTEELCREAAQKLMVECTTAASSSTEAGAQHTRELKRQQREREGEGEGGGEEEEEKEADEREEEERDPDEATTAGPQAPSPTTTYKLPPCDPRPPSYSEACSSSVQLPLQRGDGTVSFSVPPPPPPSPGDALRGNPRDGYSSTSVPAMPPVLGTSHPYGTPNPMFISGHTTYAIVPAPSPLVCAQTVPPVQHGYPPMAPQTAAPSTVINQNSTSAVSQNVNNVNVVVENNIGFTKSRYPSYIAFSLTLCIICCILDPTALVCVFPALICSCVGCCTGNYRLSKHMGRCALVWNIVALVYGITAFFLLVTPAIIVAIIIAAA